MTLMCTACAEARLYNSAVSVGVPCSGRALNPGYLALLELTDPSVCLSVSEKVCPRCGSLTQDFPTVAVDLMADGGRVGVKVHVAWYSTS